MIFLVNRYTGVAFLHHGFSKTLGILLRLLEFLGRRLWVIDLPPKLAAKVKPECSNQTWKEAIVPAQSTVARVFPHSHIKLMSRAVMSMLGNESELSRQEAVSQKLFSQPHIYTPLDTLHTVQLWSEECCCQL